MNFDKLFHTLRTKGTISRNKLYEYGADDYYIQDMIDNQIFAQVDDDTFKIDSVDELYYYGKYLLEQKRYSDANSIFICCYKTDPTNFNANFQLFYRSLIQKKKENIFKHFDVVYNYLIENEYESDANYYLYLIGTLYGVPSKYREKFNDLEEEDILLDEVDGFSIYENTFRREVIDNSYFKVNSMFDERFEYDDKEEMLLKDMVEKELILKWLVKNRNFNKMILSYLMENKINETKSLLDSEDENRFLSTTNTYLLKLVNSYITIQNTGVLPVVKYDGDDVFDAINGNNYKLAIKLVEKYQEEHNIERENVLLVMLKKIDTLIERKKGNIDLKPLIDEVRRIRGEDTNIDVLIQAVEEMRNRKTPSLTDKEKQSLDSKIKQLYNGRCAFLLDPMPKEKRDLIHEYVSGFEDIASFNIGQDANRRVVLRYKPYIKEYVSIMDTATDAKRFYRKGQYKEAAECYELLLKIGKPRDITYGGYGLTLLKLHRKNEALDYLKIATIISKENNGKLDYTDLIEGIEYPLDKENKKPKVVVKEDEFKDTKRTDLDDELLNDLIGLTSEGEISLIDACKKLNLSEENINYIKLLYARDCYYLNKTSEGDLYFKQVEKSKAKDKKVKDLYKEILVNKKYYHNRLNSSQDQLIFIKK